MIQDNQSGETLQEELHVAQTPAKKENKGKQFAIRTITGLVLAGFMIGILFLRELTPIALDVVLMLMIAVSAIELVQLFKKYFSVATIVIVALYVALLYPAYKFVNGILAVFMLGVVMFAIMQIVCLFDKKTSWNTTSAFLLILFYPALLIVGIMEMNQHGDVGLVCVLLTLVIAIFTDTFAYFFGVIIKGKKLCPKISPKKTIAGAIGGLLGGIGGAVAVWAIFNSFITLKTDVAMWIVFMILGFVGAVATQFGDLVASGLKRQLGVKDFGKIFPGHGGILDRIDGIVFNAIVVFAFFQLYVVV